MEALRYTDAGTNSKRKTKKSTGGASIPKMALANLGRNKKRTITVICSLTLGLVLLSCVYAKNASFDIDKYMSQTVISDFEVEDSSISSTFGTYNPYGTTISPELVQNIEGLSGLEATGRLYSQVFTHKIGASALENIQTYYNADDRLTYIEATDAGLAEAYHDMIDSGECISILYGIDGLILDTFAQDGRMLDGTFDKGKFLSGGYVVMEAATGAEDSGKETQPTYSVGDTVELNGQQYEVMAIVADIPTITEGVNSSTQDFLSFYLPADTFRAMYPDNTLRKLFFDVVEEYQPQAEEMLIQYQQDVDKSLGEFVRDGSFTLQSEEEIVIEQKLFLQQLHEMDSYYVNEHIVNLLLEVRGNLRTEKQEMFSTIDRFLTLPPDERLLFTVGRRLNIFFRLDDLKKPKLHQKAGESLQQILSKNPHVDFAALCNYVRQSQI